MNHEGEASSSAPAHVSRDGDGEAPAAVAPTTAELKERGKRNRQRFNQKRGQLLDDLIKDLDMLIYAELSVVYYMDCSFLRFAIRAFFQFMYLTPKPPPLPAHPSDTPMLGALVSTNAICILLHLWLTPPSGGEATRGYLHGGLAMDFIGQAGPSSKIHLFLLDLLVVVLQLTHMAAYMLKCRLKDSATTTAATASARSGTSHPAPARRQDLDAEERGVRRSGEQQEIEMQTLTATGTATGAVVDPSEAHDTANRSSEHDALLNPMVPRTDSHIFDAFHSGQIVIADLDLRKRIGDQIHLTKNYRADASTASGVRTLRAELANRVLRMRMGADALRQNI
ncbi:uncharacterized protein LTR77_003633 [Saxophila tyrrhenica]|uniref:DUF1746 domain-containing protein n=1 Tax=Saxophila tyrrhenica TaxID=1690608 RepID=A0AAV9PED4_9PEZI|nr:hypothetical protein LTR77_003633 [Saxophila tyrrhenica]